ncbi:AAA family ATPase [Starmerella bacillaris]|uniref:Vesicular-fusion protein SEC18 n=1 Tax=Starmerella bacillaris TaxID=1247836 RepID=A0AAV5RE54_STABA|nr:AAA family ATPase [Starmerella bacillaris]
MIERLGFGRKDTSSHNSGPIPSFSAVPARQLSVCNGTREIALGNYIGVGPGTFHDGQYVICDGKYVFTVKVCPELAPNLLSAGGASRDWAQWPVGALVQVQSFDIFQSGQGEQVYLADLQLEIDFFNPNRTSNEEYEQKQLADQFLQNYKSRIFAPGQILVMERKNINFRLIVKDTSVVDLDGRKEPIQNRRGVVLPQTQIGFSKSPNSRMKLKGASRARGNLFQPNFEFKNMGIGGLDKEFMTILRRAFVTRMASPRDIERLGISHVKGMLLYGPPGTGKTLIARQIGKMLNAVEPKIVNGPEMLSKFVGASEENIRKLFKDAEDEYRAKGDDSNLHIIIFDELDAVFKQRGSRGDGTGVGDNVVNQLLSKMDGVNQLNNILVIGMTNRKDLIDSALMRPGRFEIQLEIPLPDQDGRKQIFVIHTQKMRDEHLVAPDVNLDELAAMTKNYSGAEIAGVVRAASQTGLTRKTDSEKGGNVVYDDKKQLVITRADFLNALEDVKPAYGVSEETLQRCIYYGIIPFSPQVDHILTEGRKLVESVRDSRDSLMSALFHGPAGAGKTALAAEVALKSKFPFVKLISAENMTGMTEQQKVAHIQQIFADSYRSETSVIVVDDIETIVEWSDVGPRFSNMLVSTLKTLIRARPPTDKPLLVLGTSSRFDVLGRLDMTSLFIKHVFVNSVASVEELDPVMHAVGFLEPESRAMVAREIRSRTGSSVLGIGIKAVLGLITLTKATSNPANDFVEEVVDHLNSRSGKIVL